MILFPWCKYFCPIGAFTSFFNKFSILSHEVSDDCNDCGVCLKVCPMNTTPKTTDCTKCLKCNDACPQNAIRIKSPLKVER
jgi:polyferredoxin